MFGEGDRVTVMIMPKESTAQYLRKFNGQSFKVKKSKTYKGSQHTYFLEDCKTEAGMDYEFHEDWLIPTTE